MKVESIFNIAVNRKVKDTDDRKQFSKDKNKEEITEKKKVNINRPKKTRSKYRDESKGNMFDEYI